MLLKKKLIIGTVLLITAVIIYSFLWGHLFPFSPIIIGFEQSDTIVNETDYSKGQPQDFAQQSSIPGFSSFLPNCLALLGTSGIRET
jgi:hypothetical protein